MNTHLIEEDRFHIMEAAQTYIAAAIALFLANVSTWSAVLGFLLVIIRLTYEIPRAWNVLCALFGRQRNE
jgi:hypothetical protein